METVDAPMPEPHVRERTAFGTAGLPRSAWRSR